MAHTIFWWEGQYSHLDAIFEQDGVIQKTMAPSICTLRVLSCYAFSYCLQYLLYVCMCRQMCLANSIHTICIYNTAIIFNANALRFFIFYRTIIFNDGISMQIVTWMFTLAGHWWSIDESIYLHLISTTLQKWYEGSEYLSTPHVEWAIHKYTKCHAICWIRCRAYS